MMEEFVGRLASDTTSVSIARMISLGGWSERGQTPAFGEFTVVLRGTVVADTKSGSFEIHAVCLPAFAPDASRRDDPASPVVGSLGRRT